MTRRPNRISVRAGASHEQVKAMAAARTTEDQTITASDVYREMISEAVKVRVRDCSRSHRGPVKDGTCGHCGGGTK